MKHVKATVLSITELAVRNIPRLLSIIQAQNIQMTALTQVDHVRCASPNNEKKKTIMAT